MDRIFILSLASLLVLGPAFAPGAARVEAQAATTPLAADAAPAMGAKNPEYDRIVLQALGAYDAGRWDEARRLFERAHGLDPTARTLRTIGMAAFNQGDYVAALQNLEAALVDPRKPLTAEQRGHVTQLIERANQEVGRFRLRLQPETARLLVDGKSPTQSRDGELVLMPGHHELEVAARGHETLTSRLEVEARDRTVLELALRVETAQQQGQPSGELAPPQSAPLRQSGRAATESNAGSTARSTWGVVALGVGGAALVASVITGGLALSEKSKLDDACRDRRCGPTAYDRVDRYDGLRTAAGVTLAAAVVGAGVGTYLLLSGGDEQGGARVEALLSPTHIAIRGRL